METWTGPTTTEMGSRLIMMTLSDPSTTKTAMK